MTFLFPSRVQQNVERVMIGAVLVCLVLGVTRCNARRDGARTERIAQLEAENATLKAQSKRVDSTYIVDTVRLTQYRTKRDTLRLTLTLTDTVEVAGFIAVQDSTIQACGNALQTCEQRVSIRDQRIANLERQRREWEAAATCSVLRVPCPSRGTAYLLGVVTGVVGLALVSP